MSAVYTLALQVRAMRPDSARPQTLAEFVRRRGFQPDCFDRDELESIGATAPVFWRWKGWRSCDHAAEACHEAGYLWDRDSREFLEALADSLAGRGVYAFEDRALADAWARYEDACDDFVERFGLSPYAAREALEACPDFVMVDAPEHTPSPIVSRLAIVTVAHALGVAA